MFCLRTLLELKLLKFLSESDVSKNVRLSSLPLLPLRAYCEQTTSILDIVKPPSLDSSGTHGD